MPLHPDTHTLRSTIAAMHGPGDTLYKGAILAAALLMLLTAWM